MGFETLRFIDFVAVPQNDYPYVIQRIRHPEAPAEGSELLSPFTTTEILTVKR